MIYRIECAESALSCINGREEDWYVQDDSYQVFDDFDNLDDAIRVAETEAEKDVIEIKTDTRYGNGIITRNVYSVYAFEEDEYGELVYCEDDYGNIEIYAFIDVLDLHPEIEKAWEKARYSYCDFLDYKDDSYWGFAEVLEEELGEDWEALPYIKRIY